MFSDPQQNLEAIGLLPGMIVADLGSGSGFYALAAARLVGDKGRVYAVDIQKDLLQKLKNVAQQQRLLNIEIIWGNLDKVGGTKIRDMSVDLALASNILFQLEQRGEFVREVKRILKRSGKVAVIDWTDSFGGMGPARAAVVKERDARELFETGGLTFERSFPAGDHHYGLVFKNH